MNTSLFLIILCLYAGFDILYKCLAKSGLTSLSLGYKKHKYNLVPFNDAVATELLNLRQGLNLLVTINDRYSWLSEFNKLDMDFILDYRFYSGYSNIAKCSSYKLPQKGQGLIIIFLDEYIDNELSYKNTSEVLRKLHSQRAEIDQLKEGGVYMIKAREFHNKNVETYDIKVKLTKMKITNEIYGNDITITLEEIIEKEINVEGWIKKRTKEKLAQLEKHKFSRTIRIFEPNHIII